MSDCWRAESRIPLHAASLLSAPSQAQNAAMFRHDEQSATRMEFLRHRRPANHSAAFQHDDLQTCSRQIGGADEPVMATADNDRIAVGACSRHSMLPRGARASRLMCGRNGRSVADLLSRRALGAHATFRPDMRVKIFGVVVVEEFFTRLDGAFGHDVNVAPGYFNFAVRQA